MVCPLALLATEGLVREVGMCLSWPWRWAKADYELRHSQELLRNKYSFEFSRRFPQKLFNEHSSAGRQILMCST